MAAVDLGWHPPSASWITDIDSVINDTGVHGFIFNSSKLPNNVPYGTYNWCNMPHVRVDEYIVPEKEYQLQYVEVVCNRTQEKSTVETSEPKAPA